ncbi:hypothetical protein QJS10_CPA01g02634 [Acorus calamus]|uniref:Uncharacterized protein n=1 Tax=Acorus calamus TaxID=4465 RepID=A0AAV9FN18_ACOCL|nr:hypothetical protein QJS10_CPA01g02634 [Acorus calamus]
MMHRATSIEKCASGFVTHQIDDLEADWVSPSTGRVSSGPATDVNVLEVHHARIQGDGGVASDPWKGGVLDGISGQPSTASCPQWSNGDLTCVFNGLLSLATRMIYSHVQIDPGKTEFEDLRSKNLVAETLKLKIRDV